MRYSCRSGVCRTCRGRLVSGQVDFGDVHPHYLSDEEKAQGHVHLCCARPLTDCSFEIEPFDRATVAAARHAAKRTREGKLVSVAGGGDTVAALNHAGVADDFTYISTAGGAFLEWMEGKPLPGVDVLKA